MQTRLRSRARARFSVRVFHLGLTVRIRTRGVKVIICAVEWNMKRILGGEGEAETECVCKDSFNLR